MPQDDSHMDVAVQKLSQAVDSLTDVVDSLRRDLHDSTLVAERLDVRCAQLESLTKELNRFLFTGNGQPAFTRQLTQVQERLDLLVRQFKAIDRTKLNEQDARSRFETIERLLSETQKAQASLEKDRQQRSDRREISRTQYVVAILGIVGSVIGSGISLLAALLK